MPTILSVDNSRNDEHRYTLHVVDLHTGMLVRDVALPGWATGLSVSPGHDVIALIVAKNLLLISPTTYETQRLVPIHGGTASAFSPDGKFVAAGTHTIVSLFDTASFALVGEGKGEYEQQDDNIFTMCFNPASTLLVTGSHKRSAVIWTVPWMHVQRVLTVDGFKSQEAVLFLANTALVTGSYRTINVWDASTGEKTAKIKGHTRAVAALALSPSGAVFASASADRTVQIFSSSTHHALHSIEFDHGVESVCFAGNDSVVAGVYSSELVVIDVGTGKIKAKLVHQTFASGVAVLP